MTGCFQEIRYDIRDRHDINGFTIHTRPLSSHYLRSLFLLPSWQLQSNNNTLRPRQNGRHFPNDIFKWIFLNGNVWISTNISLKFVPRGPINNIPTLVQVMAWRRPGDKPLSEPMMVRLPTHICVTRPQWDNLSGSSRDTRENRMHWENESVFWSCYFACHQAVSHNVNQSWPCSMTPYGTACGPFY